MNKTAEDVKLNILIDKGNGTLFSLSERKIIFEAMEAYASQSPAGWVRADKRLPIEERIEYWCDYDGVKEGATFYEATENHPQFFRFKERVCWQENFHELLWLDETPSHSEGEAVAFAEWIASYQCPATEDYGSDGFVLNDGEWYWAADKDGDQPLTEEYLYTLFTQSKP